ncbi:aryl-alcohol dehydrogenase [Pleurotus eryngii]|uniref:Aryl-alcohol dehydrogenase n=1 Tax=Pleurotus eryngii TaxID=5323 RepID=A0A9P6AB04_PLEER|nr:aryl-alcohol dehydrogenase [Pleurotus eryngii]
MASAPKKMQYVRLGNSGLKISKIVLGCMTYGSPDWQGWVLEEEEAIKHIKFASEAFLLANLIHRGRYDQGIQSFDTANVYSNGLSEIILGKAIKQHELPRDEIVVMTKLWGTVAREHGYSFLRTGANPDENGYINQHGLSRKHIFESVKHSLERLQLDYIDLLQCHRFDPSTPIEETMQALHDVVKAGYVRYIGMSSCWAYQFHAMQNYAIANKLTPFISMQNHHNLLYREEEREMFPTLKLFGVGAIPWSPLARGMLCRPLSEKTHRKETDPYLSIYDANNAGTAEIIKRVEEIATKKNISMAQVSVAWSLSKEGVSAPIVGTTSLKNLEEMIVLSINDSPLKIPAAVSIELTKEEIAYLEEPYTPLAIAGH